MTRTEQDNVGKIQLFDNHEKSIASQLYVSHRYFTNWLSMRHIYSYKHPRTRVERTLQPKNLFVFLEEANLHFGNIEERTKDIELQTSYRRDASRRNWVSWWLVSF